MCVFVNVNVVIEQNRVLKTIIFADFSLTALFAACFEVGISDAVTKFDTFCSFPDTYSSVVAPKT